MDLTRRHMHDDHSGCDYLHCAERRELEAANADSMYARAVLYAIDRRGGNAREILGDAYDQYAEMASWESPDYLPQKPSPSDIIQANMQVRQAMMGIPVLWQLSTAEVDDDFDVDAFFDTLNLDLP